ncbi:DMT family transporter [Streptomyces sp. NPDC002138]|uniref:DMT family transporter n=1 Tax=Streptomyces sp. NPDC002138 TaxID=3154410 RepID=UPI00331B4606
MTAIRSPWARIGLLALLWGSAFLWVRLSLDHGLTPAQITVVRSALGAAVLLGLARLTGRRLPRDPGTWARLLVAALFCNTLPFLLFALGQRTVDSGIAGALNATTPLWSLLIGTALGSDRPLPRTRIAGLLLGFAGVTLIFAPWRASDGLLGWDALALLGAAASYAVAFAYMARTLTGRGTDPLALSAAQLLTASVLSLLAVPLTGGWSAALTTSGTSLPGWAAVAALGVLSTGFTFYLSYRLVADEGATSAATVGYLLPVVSVALGAAVLGEHVGPRVLGGMAVVLAGVALTRVATRHSRTDPAENRLAVKR